MLEFLLEAFKAEYNKKFPDKLASLSRVHFSSWVIEKLYNQANEMDDDQLFDWEMEYIEATSPTTYAKVKKYLED